MQRQDRPGIIFIGGTGRCGTTRLWNVLDEHHDVHKVPLETHIIVAPRGLFHFAEAALKLGAAMLAGIANDFKEFAIQEHGDRLRGHFHDYDDRILGVIETMQRDRDVIRVCRDFIEDLVMSNGDAVGVKYLVEKTPRNIIAIEWIFRVFPDSKFIHIKRHPAGVIESWARMKWGYSKDLAETTDGLSQYWYEPWRKLREQARKRSNYYEVKLEDICDNTVGELEKIANFLEIEPRSWNPNAFDWGKVTRWENHEKRDELEKLAEPFMELMGYAVQGTGQVQEQRCEAPV